MTSFCAESTVVRVMRAYCHLITVVTGKSDGSFNVQLSKIVASLGQHSVNSQITSTGHNCAFEALIPIISTVRALSVHP